jgi:hypothetical protein
MPISNIVSSIINSVSELTSTQIGAVREYLSRSKIIDCEFVKMTVVFSNDVNHITRDFFMSTSYNSHTINGDTYTELGALLNVTGTQRDITSSGYDTGITLTGLDPYWIYVVAGGPASSPVPVKNQSDIPVGYYPIIKGSRVKIYRGFFNDNYELVTSALRYTGIVTSYSIQENRETGYDALNDTYTISIQCSAYKQVLQNRMSGRKTNTTSWKNVYSTDTSMDRVSGLEGKKFDFGKKPK